MGGVYGASGMAPAGAAKFGRVHVGAYRIRPSLYLAIGRSFAPVGASLKGVCDTPQQQIAPLGGGFIVHGFMGMGWGVGGAFRIRPPYGRGQEKGGAHCEKAAQVLHACFTHCEKAAQVLHTHFTHCEKATQVLHTRFTHCDDTVQVLHARFTHCERATQVLHARFTHCEKATQVLHAHFTHCEKATQVLHTHFTHCDGTAQGLHDLFSHLAPEFFSVS